MTIKGVIQQITIVHGIPTIAVTFSISPSKKALKGTVQRRRPSTGRDNLRGQSQTGGETAEGDARITQYPAPFNRIRSNIHRVLVQLQEDGPDRKGTGPTQQNAGKTDDVIETFIDMNRSGNSQTA